MPSAVLLFRGLGHVTPDHESGAAHLIGYVDSHLDSGLTFNRLEQPQSPPELIQYVDTEYGRNRTTGRADEGQVIFLNGDLVSYSMRAQTIVTQNVYEAEIVALSDGARQLSKSRNYVDGCGFPLGPTVVYEDNTSVLRYARDIGLARPSRSLNQHFHYGREKQQTGIIDVQPVESEDNIADFFTKPHSKTKFQIAAPRLGIKSVSECKNEASSPHPVEEIIDSAEMKA